MATLYTDTGQDQANGKEKAADMLKDGSVLSGVVQHAHAIHTVVADTTSDTIRIVELPAGTWILPELCTAVHQDLGTAYTITVGDETDADRFSTALDFSSAGTTTFTGGVEATTPVKLTTNTWVTATPTTITSATASATVKFNIAYKGIA